MSLQQDRNQQQAELAALDVGARPPWAGSDRQQARALFACLKQRGIAMKSTFYKMLALAPPAQRSKVVSRCQVFFDNVDTKEILSTGCLTSMISKKAHVFAFLLHSDDTVRRVAKTTALRSLTSLFHNRGFPRAEEDTQAFMERDIWWRGAGQARTLDRDLLRAFSSMFHGRGLPDKKTVEDYLGLDIWWWGEGQARTLNRELLRTFSSMFNSRGLPDKKSVEEYLQWDVWWQGEGKVRTLDWKLLRAFSSMFHSKGLPDKFRTDEILQWLQWNRSAIRVMARLHSGAYAGHRSLGLPDINKLKQAEQRLMALISAKEHDQEEDNELLPLVKRVALYLANDGGTQQLSWTDCEVWLREHSGFLAKKDVFRRLLLTLHHHGGRGVKEAMALISGKPDATKQFVLNALSRGRALAAVQYALQVIKPPEWREYLFFTRELHPVPDRQQWQRIKDYRNALALVWPNQEYQRRFLTLIWPLSPADRERFMQPEALQGLLTLLPTVQVIRQLSKSLTTAELKTLFDTYLAYRKGLADKQGLPILFKALLLARLVLFERGTIPPGILAQTHDQPEGVVIGVNPTFGVEDSVTLFIQVMAVILENLRDCEYTVNGPTLTLRPHGSTVPITLPTPYLEWHANGVQICHWTSTDLHRFYQATECCSGVYREPSESNEPGLDVIGAQLKEQVNADNNALVPESLKMFLSERDQPSQMCATDNSLIVPHSPATWLETVLRQSILSEADINQLYTYRGHLTSDQVVDILFRVDQSVSQDTVQRLYALLGDKHQQYLKSNPLWLDDSDQARETVPDVEDILRDLFPDSRL